MIYNRKGDVMKRLLIAASLALAFVFVGGAAARPGILATYVVPAVAVHNTATAQHARQYTRLYKRVARKFGQRSPGRNIVHWGLSSGRPASDGDVARSIGVLTGMLAPPPVITAPTPTIASGTTVTYSAAPSSGLAACIISRESGGNPTATNGQYGGIAQWSPSAWASMGGTKYASSPTAASYSDQVAVLNSALAAGQSGQWTPYDGC